MQSSMLLVGVKTCDINHISSRNVLSTHTADLVSHLIVPSRKKVSFHPVDGLRHRVDFRAPHSTVTFGAQPSVQPFAQPCALNRRRAT